MGDARPGAPWAEVIASFRSIYSALAPERVRPFPGIPETLSTLHARGIPLVIVTSKRRSIAEADCARTGLAAFLAGVVGSDCSTRHKPDPEPATLACARYGITPGAGTLVVGDAAVDLRMGRAAGLSTCAALWGAHSPQALLSESPDFVAREPRDLLSFFGAE
jgi:pyrophosphatase PpaX